MNIDEVVTDIVDRIVQGSKQTNATKAEILAQVMERCLLSSDENPNHIYASDLFCKCDKCFSNSTE